MRSISFFMIIITLLLSALSGCDDIGGALGAAICGAVGKAGSDGSVTVEGSGEICLTVGDDVGGFGSPRGDDWAIISESVFYDGVQDVAVSCNVESPMGSSNGVIADWATDGGSRLELYIPIDDPRISMACSGAVMVNGVWLDIFYDVDQSANAAAVTNGVTVGQVPVYAREWDGTLEVDGTRAADGQSF